MADANKSQASAKKDGEKDSQATQPRASFMARTMSYFQT